jgi:hypothetical protein
MEEVEMRQCLEEKFVDAHENLCNSVGGLQLVLAVTVLGKEGSGRDKSTQNVVNYKRNMVERVVAKFDDSQRWVSPSSPIGVSGLRFCNPNISASSRWWSRVHNSSPPGMSSKTFCNTVGSPVR